jgi:hypothetical protein
MLSKGFMDGAGRSRGGRARPQGQLVEKDKRHFRPLIVNICSHSALLLGRILDEVARFESPIDARVRSGSRQHRAAMEIDYLRLARRS